MNSLRSPIGRGSYAGVQNGLTDEIRFLFAYAEIGCILREAGLSRSGTNGDEFPCGGHGGDVSLVYVPHAQGSKVAYLRALRSCIHGR